LEEGIRGTESFFLIPLKMALSSHRKLASAEMSVTTAVFTKTTQAQNTTVKQETIHAISERTDADWLRGEQTLLLQKLISD
jgi:hypothetical protein